MANRFWVGGTTTWDATAGTKWALTSGGAGGQAVPTAADDVFFDANSGANTVTFATNTTIHSLDFTGFTGTFACSGSRTLTMGGSATTATAAVLTLGSGMTFSGGGTALNIVVDNRGGGTTITSNGITMNGLTSLEFAFSNASQTTTTVADNMNVGAAALDIKRGGLTITSGKTVTTTGDFSYQGAAGTTTLTYSSATLSCGSFTWNTGGTLSFVNTSGTLKVTGAHDSATTLITLNGQTLNGGTVRIDPANAPTGSALVNASGGTIQNLTFAGFASAAEGLIFTSALTVTGTLTITGNTAYYPVMVRNNTYGTTRTLTVTGASFSLTDVVFQDITMSGATASGTRIGDAGGNSGITFSTPKNCYFVGSAAAWHSNSWASTSGAASNSQVPLPQDTAIFDNNSGNVSSSSAQYYPIIDTTARTSAITLYMGNAVSGTPAYLMGNVTLNSFTTLNTVSGSTLQTSLRSGTQTWTTSGATIAPATTLLQALNVSATLSLADGFSWSTIGDTTTGLSLQTGTITIGNATLGYFINAGAGGTAINFTSGKTVTFTGANASGNAMVFTTTPTVTSNGSNLSFTGGSVAQTVTLLGLTWGNVTVAPGAGTLAFEYRTTSASGTSILNSVAMTTTGTKTITFDNTLGSSSIYRITSPSGFCKGSPGGLVSIQSTNSAATVTIQFDSPCFTEYVTTSVIAATLTTASPGTPAMTIYHGGNAVNLGSTGITFIDSMPGTFASSNVTSFQNLEFAGGTGGGGVLAFGERRPVY